MERVHGQGCGQLRIVGRAGTVCPRSNRSSVRDSAQCVHDVILVSPRQAALGGRQAQVVQMENHVPRPSLEPEVAVTQPFLGNSKSRQVLDEHHEANETQHQSRGHSCARILRTAQPLVQGTQLVQITHFVELICTYIPVLFVVYRYTPACWKWRPRCCSLKWRSR